MNLGSNEQAQPLNSLAEPLLHAPDQDVSMKKARASVVSFKDRNNMNQENFAEISKIFKSNRKRTGPIIIFGFICLFLILLELVFSNTLFTVLEIPLQSKIQNALGLKTNPIMFLYYFNAILTAPISLYIITFVMFTIYHGYDCILGTKQILVSTLVFSITKMLTIIHLEPRPFWMRGGDDVQAITGYGCVNTFANPDMALFIPLFFVSYQRVCMEKAAVVLTKSNKLKNLVYAIIYVFIVAMIVLRYISGEIFIIQIITQLIYNMFFTYGLSLFDGKVNKIVEWCTFKARTENKYIIRYFIFALFVFIFELVYFQEYNDESNLNISYLNNYVKCKQFFQVGKFSLSIKNSIGWYPTYNMNTSMIGMITALLSIHYIFRQISLDSYWFRPTTKERVIRVCLSNLLVVIGLAGEFWVSKMQNSLDQLGIRIIFVNGIMLVFVYAISLAILPRILFQRIHKSQKRRMYSFVSLEKSKFQSKRNQDANLSEGVDKKDAMSVEAGSGTHKNSQFKQQNENNKRDHQSEFSKNLTGSNINESESHTEYISVQNDSMKTTNEYFGSEHQMGTTPNLQNSVVLEEKLVNCQKKKFIADEPIAPSNSSMGYSSLVDPSTIQQTRQGNMVSEAQGGVRQLGGEEKDTDFTEMNRDTIVGRVADLGMQEEEDGYNLKGRGDNTLTRHRTIDDDQNTGRRLASDNQDPNAFENDEDDQRKRHDTAPIDLPEFEKHDKLEQF